MRTKHDLERYLAKEILNKSLPRKPPAKERRGPERDAEYRQWIRTLPCCACGANPPTEAAHTGHDGGKSQKSSDYSVIPLCRDCHTAGPHSYHGLNSSARAFRTAARPGLRADRGAAERGMEDNAKENSMKINKLERVPLDKCRSRALEYLSSHRRQDLVVANCVAIAIWPTHQMTSQGAGAAASRILKGLEKDGLVAWASTIDNWGYRITSAGRALVEK